jgi:predicted HTH domain antitoxin
MNLVIQDSLLEGVQISEGEARLDFAIGLFVDRRISLERAARIAGVSQTQFLRQLGERGVAVHYDLDDLKADLQTIAGLAL